VSLSNWQQKSGEPQLSDSPLTISALDYWILSYTIQLSMSSLSASHPCLTHLNQPVITEPDLKHFLAETSLTPAQPTDPQLTLTMPA
jgi:hypothetical protein